MIDWNKPIRTVVEKHPARVICKDLKSRYPIVVAVFSDGLESVYCCDEDGYNYYDYKMFENVPQKVYINLYRHNSESRVIISEHSTMETAQQYRCEPNNYIKTIEVEI